MIRSAARHRDHLRRSTPEYPKCSGACSGRRLAVPQTDVDGNLLQGSG